MITSNNIDNLHAKYDLAPQGKMRGNSMVDDTKCLKSPITWAHKVSNMMAPDTKSLFKAFGLTTFGYKRVYRDGRYFFISTNKKWITHHIESIQNHGHFFSSAMRHAVQEGHYNIPWPQESLDTFLQSLHAFGMFNGLNFYKAQKDCIDLWTFSTDREKYVRPGSYIPVTHHLEDFIRFFYAKYYALFLSPPKEALVCMSQNFDEIFSGEPSINPQQLENFKRSVQIKKFPLMGNMGLVYLSPREYACVCQMAQGKTSKEIARNLELTPKTIEGYIENIKFKTNFHTKSEILDSFHTIQRELI